MITTLPYRRHLKQVRCLAHRKILFPSPTWKGSSSDADGQEDSQAFFNTASLVLVQVSLAITKTQAWLQRPLHHGIPQPCRPTALHSYSWGHLWSRSLPVTFFRPISRPRKVVLCKNFWQEAFLSPSIELRISTKLLPLRTVLSAKVLFLPWTNTVLSCTSSRFHKERLSGCLLGAARPFFAFLPNKVRAASSHFQGLS